MHDDFGWLDITHGLTYANAARWLVASRARPRHGPACALHRLPRPLHRPLDAGGARSSSTPAPKVDDQRATSTPTPLVADARQRPRRLRDRRRPRHQDHLRGARRVGRVRLGRCPAPPSTGSCHGPRTERFVARSTIAAIDLLNGRGPARGASPFCGTRARCRHQYRQNAGVVEVAGAEALEVEGHVGEAGCLHRVDHRATRAATTPASASTGTSMRAVSP